MNSLSWLIYLSDMLPNVAATAGGFAISLGMVLAVLIFLNIMWKSTEKTEFPLNVPWKSLISLFVFLVTISTVTPSRNTILLIAASEYGEKVIKSEVGGQSLRILKNKLSEIELEQTRKRAQ
jgi:phosphatidylserine synthase